jgi:hypothetical protein
MLLYGIVNELKKSMVKKEYTGRTASPYHNLQYAEIVEFVSTASP